MSTGSRQGRTPAEQAAAVPTPALVLTGTEGPPWMAETARDLADALPHGRCHVIAGRGHVVPPTLLAPVLMEFLAGQRPAWGR